MSLISTRSRYGLRMLIDIAQRGGQAPVDLGGVAERQGISEHYLAKLAIPLKAAGILRAERGARGGYVLSRNPESIDLLSIVEVLEGRSSLLECTESPEMCARSDSCPTLPIWKGLDSAVRGYLGSISLADAARPRAPDFSI